MIRILRLAGAGTFISGRVFDDSFACNLYPELSVDQVDLATWLDSIFGRERLRPGNRIVHESFRSTTRGFDFLCPNYVAISVAPLLLHLRNRSRAPIRLLLIAHAPGAYALEWALLRPLLRNGDVIVAPTRSARGVINFLSPELTAYTRVIPHPVRPLPYSRFGYRPLVVSLSRVHPSKLLHRQIEAIALVRQRGNRTVRMRIAGPVHDPGAWGMSSYARSLSAKIRRLQLEDCVELVVKIDRLDQKSRFISEARLLVNLSVTIEESFGKAIVEALGRGVPVLGTRWNGLPETIGAGGVSVPVDVTPLGMDVSVERIAAAIELLLDDPPSCEKCRDEALRFQPQRVRRLYREKLDAAMQASTANGPTQNGAPERDAPASPSSGLLGVTAPLTQYSWSELFALHLRDEARLRETLAGVAHRDTSEADEL